VRQITCSMQLCSQKKYPVNNKEKHLMALGGKIIHRWIESMMGSIKKGTKIQC
jgi:hypothetical protein